MTGNDLVQAGYRPTGAKAKLTTKFDWMVEREIEDNPSPGHYKLTARDVRGIP
jgi:hypothetical protein